MIDDLYQGAVPALLPFLAVERHHTYAGLTSVTLAAGALPVASLALASRLREPRSAVTA